MSADLDIGYRPRGRIFGHRVGSHPSRATGAVGAYRDEVPFMAHPDARRIDVRATLRDPFENTFVRRFHQRAAIDVYALVDLSGSLDYVGRARKKNLIVSLCSTLARSATRIGDRFGMIGCDEMIREDCVVPITRRHGISAEVRHVLEATDCRGGSAAGLLAAAERLVGTRKMVFLISDFLLPRELMRRVFEQLAMHDIIPVMIGDRSEDELLPDWGLMEFADLETGARRLVFMRPSLKARWLAEAKDRLSSTIGLARQFGRTPVMIRDVFDAEHVSRQMIEA